jgi:DNA topoisomerase-2
MPPKKLLPKNTSKSAKSTQENDETQIVQRIAKQQTDLEHVKKKEMYTGSKKAQDMELYLYDSSTEKISLQTIRTSPAFMKVIDEVIVNAIDHHVIYPNLVKNIKISYDIPTKMITVFNDGPGISCVEVENVNGVKMLMPQMIATEFRSGSNHDNDDNEERTTGGTNGYGMKLTNAYSKWMKLETNDLITSTLYSQEYHDGITKIDPPVIKKSPAKSKGYTQISFILNYDMLGQSLDDGGKTVLSIVQNRAYQAYASTNCNVYFNDELLGEKFTIGKNRFENFVNLFEISQDYVMTKMRFIPPDETKSLHEDWDICIAISSGKLEHFSLINGIYVIHGGTHIDHIKKSIVFNLKDNVEKILNKAGAKFNKNYIENNLFIFVRATMPNPNFSSQTKEKLETPVDVFKHHYFSETDYKKIWKMIEIYVEGKFIDRASDKTTRVKNGEFIPTKGRDATFAKDKKKRKDCVLFVCEGDSAMGLIKNAVGNPKTDMEWDYCGYYSIQGVPPCAHKKVSIVHDKRTGISKIVRNVKLNENIRLEELRQMLGLEYGKKYDTQAEMNTLRYGALYIITDADLDGKGNIFGLILDYIALFWSELITNEFVRFYNTPIIKARPKLKKSQHKFVKEFFFESEYKKWLKENFDNNNNELSKYYDVTYYKGLGSHEKKDIPRLFGNYRSKETIIVNDEKASENLEAFYGKESNIRKQILRQPIELEVEDERRLTVTQQLYNNTAPYMRDNNFRKIPHIMDGFNLSKRAIMYAMMKLCGKINRADKVASLVGKITAISQYHHGEASLQATMSRMAQSFPGTNSFPFIMDKGDFGTRSTGGSKFASPRYTRSCLNKDLFFAMFPKEDFDLLPQKYDEGEHCGPEYFASIIPQMMENIHLPSTGWAVHIFARNYKEVIENVRNLITGKIKKAKPMNIWLNKIKCDIRKSSTGKLWSVGTYEPYDPETECIVITELPLRTYSAMYSSVDPKTIKKMAKKKKDANAKTAGGKAVKPKKKKVKETKETKENKDEFDDVSQNGDDDQIDDEDEKSEKLDNRYLLRYKPFVQSVDDKTTDDAVRIEVHIAPEDVKKIEARFGNENFDCWEEFFKLKTDISDLVNVINEKNVVVEYGNKYENMLMDWYVVRKNLYMRRIERQILLIELEAIYLRNVIRFVKNHASYNITSKTDLDQAVSILRKEKYDWINPNIAFNPKFRSNQAIRDEFHLKVETVEDEVVSQNIDDEPGQDEIKSSSKSSSKGYDYLLNLSYKDKLKSSAERLQKKLIKIEEEQKILQNDVVVRHPDEEHKGNEFTGCKTWLRELDTLEKIMDMGVENGWRYDEEEDEYEDEMEDDKSTSKKKVVKKTTAVKKTLPKKK